MSLLSIAAAGLGGVTGALGNIYAAKKSAKSAKQINERQIEWEIERAKNAHQWEVEDLKNAKLNPILSAGGSGATTSGISAVQPDTSGYANAGQNLLNSAQTIVNMKNQTKATNSQIALNRSQSMLNDTNTDFTKGIKSEQLKNDIERIQAETKVNSAKEAELRSEIGRKQAETILNKQKTKTEKENTIKAHNEAWESLHRSQNYDSQRDYYKRKASGHSAKILGQSATW